MAITLKNIPDLLPETTLADPDISIIGGETEDDIKKRALGGVADHMVANAVIAGTVGDNTGVPSLNLPEVTTVWGAPFFPNRIGAQVAGIFNLNNLWGWGTWRSFPCHYVEFDHGRLPQYYPELCTDDWQGITGQAFRLPHMNPSISGVSVYLVSVQLLLTPSPSDIEHVSLKMYIGVFRGEPGRPPEQIWSTRVREFWADMLPTATEIAWGDSIIYHDENRESGLHHWIMPMFMVNKVTYLSSQSVGTKFSIVKLN